jgi:L-amino acid N-acyltransferase YncA
MEWIRSSPGNDAIQKPECKYRKLLKVLKPATRRYANLARAGRRPAQALQRTAKSCDNLSAPVGGCLMPCKLERMTEAHRSAVIDIFNYHIENSFAVFLEKPVPPEFFDRFLEMTRGRAALVAKSADRKIVGFGLLRAHLPYDSFRRTAELSYFLLPGNTGQGIGTALLERLVAAAEVRGIDRLLAQVSSLNEQSMAFHLARGFTECGRLPGVGLKFGRRFDVVWFVRCL